MYYLLSIYVLVQDIILLILLLSLLPFSENVLICFYFVVIPSIFCKVECNLFYLLRLVSYI